MAVKLTSCKGTKMPLAPHEKLKKKKIKQLFNTVSNDETRLHLNGVYHCSDRQALISTNGHCLTHLKSFYSDNLKDVIIDPKTMSEMKYVSSFPKVSQVIPNNLSKLTRGVVKIEKKHYQKNKGRGFSMSYEKVFLHQDDKEKSLFYLSLEKSKGAILCFNASFFKVLADESTYPIAFSNKTGPVLFSFHDTWDEPQAMDDFTIIMPVLI